MTDSTTLPKLFNALKTIKTKLNDEVASKANGSHTHTAADISDLPSLFSVTEMSDTDVDNAMSILLDDANQNNSGE